MLVWVTLLAGLLVIVVGTLLMTRVDRRWRPRHQRCGRCREAWFGEGRFCHRCGARGRAYDLAADEARLRAGEDWPGWLDTGPVPLVDVPEQRHGHPPRQHDVWQVPPARPGA